MIVCGGTVALVAVAGRGVRRTGDGVGNVARVGRGVGDGVGSGVGAGVGLSVGGVGVGCGVGDRVGDAVVGVGARVVVVVVVGATIVRVVVVVPLGAGDVVVVDTRVVTETPAVVVVVEAGDLVVEAGPDDIDAVVTRALELGETFPLDVWTSARLKPVDAVDAVADSEAGAAVVVESSRHSHPITVLHIAWLKSRHAPGNRCCTGVVMKFSSTVDDDSDDVDDDDDDD